jgi:hypothetical protein
VFQLCALAQSWANHLAHINTFYYRNDRDVGQNLFCRPTNSIQTDVTGNVSCSLVLPRILLQLENCNRILGSNAETLELRIVRPTIYVGLRF